MGCAIRRLPASQALLVLAILLCVDARGAPAGAFNDPESSVVVLPLDGRPEQPVPVVHRGGTRFLPLSSLAGALGVSYSWDPYTYRGWIATDSVRTQFTFDSPLLIHGEEIVQMLDVVSYGEQGVLFPLDYLTVLTERLGAGRKIAWRPAEGRFTWSTAEPQYRKIRVAEMGHRSTVRIAGALPRNGLLLYSPMAGLDVLLDGASPSPESLTVTSTPGPVAVRSLGGWGSGSRIRLDIAPGTVGARVRLDREEQVWELLTTDSKEEADRNDFWILPQVDIPERRRSGPILIAVRPDFALDPAEADYALADLADRLTRTLVDTLAQPAVLYDADKAVLRSRAATRGSGASATGLAVQANQSSARAVIVLRLDGYGTGGNALQIWSAAPRLRWESLTDRGASSPDAPRPLLWSETPALAAAESDRIATTIAAHLEAIPGTGTIPCGRRPSRWLEGILCPALLVYPASVTDPLSIERLLDPVARRALAHALAFGISEAVAESAFENPRR